MKVNSELPIGKLFCYYDEHFIVIECLERDQDHLNKVYFTYLVYYVEKNMKTKFSFHIKELIELQNNKKTLNSFVRVII